MSEQTPHVTELWWVPQLGLMVRRGSGYRTHDIRCKGELDELPAGAVKLGDVEALRAQLDELVGVWCALSEQERDEVDDHAPDLYRALELATTNASRRTIAEGETR